MHFIEFLHPYLVRENHLDTFGHVNNATYFQIFEEIRWEIITKNGYGLKEVHARQQGPIALEAEIKFLKELRLREEITIRTRVYPYEGKVGKLEQAMLKGSGDVACEACFKFGFFDMRERRLIAPTEAWLKALSLPASG